MCSFFPCPDCSPKLHDAAACWNGGCDKNVTRRHEDDKREGCLMEKSLFMSSARNDQMWRWKNFGCVPSIVAWCNSCGQSGFYSVLFHYGDK
jgi:hypothetical protein